MHEHPDLVIAPFGVKTHTLGMALFAIEHNCGMYYTQPKSYNPAYTEGFETTAAASYTSHTMGFIGDDRCDFNTDTVNGRVSTFINTGFARTGNRCATLDAVHYSLGPTADSLTTTFNLSNYSASDQIWLDFYYQNQGITFSLPGNQVWIRGNDQSPWIPVYTLDSNAANIGVYQPSSHINVTGILQYVSQSVGSSFQSRRSSPATIGDSW